MKRRQFLKVLGGGVVLGAVGVGANAMRSPQAALAPWDNAGGYSDPRLAALSHAILAPNPHNMQPWMVKLVGEDTVELYVDRDRLLPHTDPFNRQITIGLGCFLEMARMATAQNGHGVEITPFPDGADEVALDDRMVARLTFGGTASADPLFAVAPNRRSSKDPFDVTRPVTQDVLDQIMAAGEASGRVGGSVAAADVAHWREVTGQALVIELETPRTYEESVDVFRIGAKEVNAQPDGIDFTGPMFETARLFGLLSRNTALDRTSLVYTSSFDVVLQNTRSAMGHIWIVTETNARLDQLATGADWLRINLAATAQGVGFHPLSQPLQEYPEMADLYAATHARLAPTGGTVQMLARIGYGPDAAPAPRWGIEDKLIG